MPIYLDVQGAQSRESGHRGIGRYVHELAAELARGPHADAVAGYVVNPDLPVPPALAAALPRDRDVRSGDLALGPGDAYHVTSPFENVALDRVWPPAARADGVGLVVTVFDLIPLIYPEHYLSDAAYHARYENRLELIRLADRVLAISEATARDAVAMLNLPPERVAVAGTGVSARFRPPAAGEDPLARVRAVHPAVRGGYVLYTGALDFRKNVDALLIAYARLPRALRAEHQLVLVSRLSPAELDALRPRLRALDLTDDVVVADAVGDDDLVALYQAARLFVFPSLYEGFGLPVAEAIACGTPTLASDSSSLVEIVTSPAGRFDPRDPEALRAALERALTDPAAAAELAAARLDPRHTWPSVAERTIAACREAERARPAGEGRRATVAAALKAAEDASWIDAAAPPAERGPLRSAVRAALWPLRRFFDPRFAGVDTHVTTMHADLSARMDRAFGPWGGAGSLTELERAIARVEDALRAGGGGSAAQALASAHALTALGRLAPGARVLDASSPPSGLAPLLAALGYETAVLASLPASAPRFDAVVALGAADGAHELARHLAPGGVLVASVEAAAGGDLEGRLRAALGALERLDVRRLARVRDGAWIALADGATADGELVALAVARPAARRGAAAPPQAPVAAVPASEA
jgi:glycosyltransferase involved in cell wall biosynthesis